jgi:hypothetical protein
LYIIYLVKIKKFLQIEFFLNETPTQDMSDCLNPLNKRLAFPFVKMDEIERKFVRSFLSQFIYRHIEVVKDFLSTMNYFGFFRVLNFLISYLSKLNFKNLILFEVKQLGISSWFIFSFFASNQAVLANCSFLRHGLVVSLISKRFTHL